MAQTRQLRLLWSGVLVARVETAVVAGSEDLDSSHPLFLVWEEPHTVGNPQNWPKKDQKDQEVTHLV